jgi:replicative DNA helicase
MAGDRRLDKAPPYSEEAEQGVLGSVIIEPGVFGLLRADMGLKEDSFYIPAHRIVWAAMEKLAELGRPIDTITLVEQLKREQTLEKCGGPMFLDGLVERTPTAAHAEFYGEQVRQCWSRRKVIESARKMEALANDPGCEDARTAAAKGVEMLCEVLEERRRSTTNAEYMSEAMKDWERLAGYRQRKEAVPLLGYPTGLDRLDDVIDGMQKNLIVLGARQSTGKTTLEGQVVGFMCDKIGMPVLRITRDSKIADLWKRDICREAGVSLAKMNKGFLYEKGKQVVTDTIKMLEDWPVRIVDDAWRIRDVCALIRADVAKRGTKLVTIDFLQMFRVGDPRIDGDRNGRMEEVLTQLKGLVLELKIPIMCLSQFARDKDRLTGKSGINWIETRPILEDLKDSGSIEQLADVGILLSKVDDIPDEEGHTGKVTVVACDVAKNKNGPTGPVFLRFDRPYFKMSEFGELEQRAVVKFLYDEITVKRMKGMTWDKIKDQPVFQSVAEAIERAREMPERRH